MVLLWYGHFKFDLPESGSVKLCVYNVRGQKLATLVNSTLEQSAHTVTWKGVDDSGRTQASGVYFYRLQAAGKTLTNKMLLLK